jgi:hypothetical protein
LARVQALLKPEQQQLEADARTDLAFLVNGSVGGAVVCLSAIGDFIVGGSWSGRVIGIAFGAVLATLFYRLAADAATKWAADIQGSLIDVSRHELYDRIGVARPTTLDDERTTAGRINAFLLRGSPLDAELFGAPGTPVPES